MSHGECKVELSQAQLRHVYQVEQKGKCLSGREDSPANHHLTMTSPSLSGSPHSPSHFLLRLFLMPPLLLQLWPALPSSVSLNHLHLSSLLSCPPTLSLSTHLFSNLISTLNYSYVIYFNLEAALMKITFDICCALFFMYHRTILTHQLVGCCTITVAFPRSENECLVLNRLSNIIGYF